VILACVATHTAIARARLADDTSPTVGVLGDPNRIEFKGSSPFSVEQMRDGISGDLEIQLAGEPTAPRQEYLSTLDRRLREGFKAQGFFRPSVDIRPDAAGDRVIVTLDLGPRRRCGAVDIQSPTTLPVADQLRQKLTTPATQPFFGYTADDNSITMRMDRGASAESGSTRAATTAPPAWDDKDWAHFSGIATRGLSQQVQQALAELGYFAPKLDVSVEPDGDASARLVVHITEPGPTATVDHVEVSGLKRNAAADVIQYLQLQTGDAIDLPRLNAAQRRLWDCGRFKKHVLSCTRLRDDPGRVNLRVDLEEVPNLPLLTQSLSQVEKAVLAFRQWLTDVNHHDDDLVVELHGPPFDGAAIFRRDQRFAVQLRNVEQAWPTVGDDGDLGVDVSGNHVALLLPKAGLKFVGPGRDRMKVTVGVGYTPTILDDGTTKWSLKLEASTTSQAEGEPPFELQMRFAPAAFLDLAHKTDWQYTAENGTVSITGDGFKARIDEASGRPIEFEAPLSNGGWITVQSAHEALEKLLAGIDVDAAANRYDAARPAASFVSFLVEAACHLDVDTASTADRRLQLARAVNKVITPDVFARLEQWAQGTDEQFNIPFDWTVANGANNMMVTWARAAMIQVNHALTRGTWPWTLANCTCMALAGRTDAIEREMLRLYWSDQTGPLAFLATAELMQAMTTNTAKLFAARGLRDLSKEAFVRDCRQFIAADRAGVVMRIADNVRRLSAADADALTSALPPRIAPAVRAAIDQLRTREDVPLDNAVEAALAAAWDQGLKTAVETELRRIGGMANPTTAP
jgi:hypothetical protein